MSRNVGAMFQCADPFTPAPTNRENEARIEEHWANVRADILEGKGRPDTHRYRNDVSHIVDMHRALARTCRQGAELHEKLAREIAQEENK